VNARRRVRLLATVVSVAAVVGVLAGSLHSGLAAARERARRSVCSANINAVLYVCQLYAGDYEERFPSDLDALFGDYVTDGYVFLCPSASKATEATLEGLGRPGASGAPRSIHPEHTDYVYVSGLIAADPPEYALMFDDEWNHDGDGAHVGFVGGQVQWMGAEELHGLLAKQGSELAARGREMKLVRPAWSSWPAPSASDDPRAGPKGRPWYEGRSGAGLVGAVVGAVVGAFVFLVIVAGKPGAGDAELWVPELDGPLPMDKDDT
jgi:hypothetical protein